MKLVTLTSLFVLICMTNSQSTDKSTPTPTTVSPQPVVTTKTEQPTTHTATTTSKTTESPSTTATACSAHNDDCDSCVKASKAKCIYCGDEKLCKMVDSKDLFVINKVCKGGLKEASWATCSVNMLALIIGMGVVGGVLILSVCCCICCCCCCKNSARQKLKWLKEDAKNDKKTEERKAKYAERRAERQAKNDEIRKKYGLFKDSEGGYQRFDNDDA